MQKNFFHCSDSAFGIRRNFLVDLLSDWLFEVPISDSMLALHFSIADTSHPSTLLFSAESSPLTTRSLISPIELFSWLVSSPPLPQPTSFIQTNDRQFSFGQEDSFLLNRRIFSSSSEWKWNWRNVGDKEKPFRIFCRNVLFFIAETKIEIEMFDDQLVLICSNFETIFHGPKSTKQSDWTSVQEKFSSKLKFLTRKWFSCWTTIFSIDSEWTSRWNLWKTSISNNWNARFIVDWRRRFNLWCSSRRSNSFRAHWKAG